MKISHAIALATLAGCAGIVVLLPATLSVSAPNPSAVPVAGFQIVARYPHDPSAFTQGLAFDDGKLFEGTGQYGRSTLRQVDLQTGTVQRQVSLPARLFGEGISVWAGEIVQLTWRAQLGLRYDRDTFARTGDFHLPGQGWGITHDNEHWIISDGSDVLRFLNPSTQQEVRRVRVQDGPKTIQRLNELEFIEGEVWANIWYEDRLVRIAPADGSVLGYVDLSRLWPRSERPDPQAVLNGIAYDVVRKRLFVTGKHCPHLYQIQIVAGE
jgi:glutamine cyclotransferase